MVIEIFFVTKDARNMMGMFVCFMMVLLFVYTSINKLIDMKVFITDIRNQPFPEFIKPLLVWAVPITELVTASLLIFAPTRLIGLYLSFSIMFFFTLYTALVLSGFFKYVPCSCGGVIKNLNWKGHLLFNLFFLILSFLGILIDRNKNNYRKNFMHGNRQSRKPE